jgi:hypothetical protein
MGRWAYFDTSLEYKFTFASQPTEDILAFGGTPGDFQKLSDEEYYYLPHDVTWTSEDIPEIDKCLKELEDEHKITRPSFDNFPFTEDGTHKLQEFFWSSKNERTPNKYYLGILIFHQLHYTIPLSASFEW